MSGIQEQSEGMVPETLGNSRTAQTAEDEGALLARLRGGDERAFEQLVRQHAGRMTAVARRFVRNEDEAGEIVQDALISAFRGIGKFGGGSRLGTWLHRIVVNAALMRLRARRRRPEQSIDGLLPRFAADGHHERPQIAWESAPSASMQREEAQRIVRQAIAGLPESYRTVLLLRDIEQLDTAATAELLETTPEAVKVRLHRARLALRAALDEAVRAGEL